MENIYYLGVQAKGTISLPADIRRRLHLDEPGAQVELIEQEDGTLRLRPTLPVDAEQRWFWTERWQAMEREVDNQYANGKGSVHDSSEEFLQHLDSLRQ